MSMLCKLYRITPDHIPKLKDRPDALGELLDLAPPPSPKASFLSRLLGRPATQVPMPEREFAPIAGSDIFELDQAWHILHFLFSGSNTEGSWPSAFLMSGGEEMGPDRGYGPVRLLAPALSREISAFLNTRSFETLDATYVASDIEAAEIYWQASPEPTERQRQVDELWRVVSDLQAFFERTVQTDSATLVSIY